MLGTSFPQRFACFSQQYLAVARVRERNFKADSSETPGLISGTGSAHVVNVTASGRNICRHVRSCGQTSARPLKQPVSTASQVQDVVHPWISSARRRDDLLRPPFDQPQTHVRPDTVVQPQLDRNVRLYQLGSPDLPSKTQSVAAVYFHRPLGRPKGRLLPAIGPFPSLTSVEAKCSADDAHNCRSFAIPAPTLSKQAGRANGPS